MRLPTCVAAGQGFRLEGFDNPPASMQSILNHAESERHGDSTSTSTPRPATRLCVVSHVHL